MTEQHMFKRGTPIIFRADGLVEYAGLTGRVIDLDGDQVWVEFDDLAAFYRSPYAPQRPVGKGTWTETRFIEALPTHDGKLSEQRRVEYYDGFFSGNRNTYSNGIRIFGEYDNAHLTYKEALSLLEWLTQQKPTLEQNARETE